MSYEGYEQHLCGNGHLWAIDAYDGQVYDSFINGESTDSKPKCPHCNGASVFFHSVDTTNDEGETYPFEEITSEVRETCNFGHVHVTKPATYKIPVK